RRVEDLCARGARKLVRAVDVRLRLDAEGDVVQARRVELERLLRLGPRGLPQSERAGTVLREAQVVDLLAALARRTPRLAQPERPEHGRVEGERPPEVAADEIEMPEPDQHLVTVCYLKGGAERLGT